MYVHALMLFLDVIFFLSSKHKSKAVVKTSVLWLQFVHIEEYQ